MRVEPFATGRFSAFQISKSQTLKANKPKRSAIAQDAILFQGQPSSKNSKGFLPKLKTTLDWLFIKPFQWLFRKIGLIFENTKVKGKPASEQAKSKLSSTQNTPSQSPLLNGPAPSGSSEAQQSRASIQIAEQTEQSSSPSQDRLNQAESTISESTTTARTISSLHEAVEYGTIDDINKLIHKDNALNSFDENGNTPLHIAARNGNASFVKILLDAGAKALPNTHNEKTALHEAARNNHSKIVAHLLNCGADGNALTFAHETPLHIACRKGHTASIQELLKSNINLNKVSKDTGDTALHLAVEEGHIEAVKLLLEKKPLLDIKNKDGQTPLDLALQKGFTEIEVLIKKQQQRHPSGVTQPELN